jgi:hypothetical protein
MKSDRLMIWKFESAPSELQTLRVGGVTPYWVALVPAALYGADLHEAIVTQTGLTDIAMHRMEDGDVVYFGSSDPAQFVEIVGSATRTHSSGSS